MKTTRKTGIINPEKQQQHFAQKKHTKKPHRRVLLQFHYQNIYFILFSIKTLAAIFNKTAKRPSASVLVLQSNLWACPWLLLLQCERAGQHMPARSLSLLPKEGWRLVVVGLVERGPL